LSFFLLSLAPVGLGDCIGQIGFRPMAGVMMVATTLPGSA
jgi:hypothetical protein